jgi:hypothetical protein
MALAAIDGAIADAIPYIFGSGEVAGQEQAGDLAGKYVIQKTTDVAKSVIPPPDQIEDIAPDGAGGPGDYTAWAGWTEEDELAYVRNTLAQQDQAAAEAQQRQRERDAYFAGQQQKQEPMPKRPKPHPGSHPAYSRSHPLNHKSHGGYAHSLQHLPWVIKHPPLFACCKKKELKYYDVNNCVALGTTGVFADLVSGITQGNDNGERSGRHIRIHHIEVRGVLTSLAEAQGGPAWTRLIFGLDQQPNGAVPTGANVFSTSGTTMNNLLSNYNLNYGDRFDILHDQILVQNQVATGIYHEGKAFHWSKDIDIHVHYSASTGAITDVVSNTLWVYYQAIMSGGDDFAGQLYFNTRIFFTDE